MAKLNADEQKLLEELTARAQAPDEDDDFEIEVYDTNAGKGARIPYRKGKGWLADVFGIGAQTSSEEGEGEAPTGEDAPRTGGGSKAGKASEGGYFQRGLK